MRVLLTLVFVLSGAAGLMYESIWSRYLGLFVGHSAYAQVIVLVIFLGGMSAGAVMAARRSARLREPLLWYAAIEGVVGVLGLVFHDIFTATTAASYDTIFPALAGSGMLVVVKWTIAGLLILPQSVMLGATFPLMSAGMIRRFARSGGTVGGTDGAAGPERDGSGRILGVLYFANSLGAALGVLIAGFWLIGLAGLPGTLVAAAIINLVVALVTFAAVRLEADDEDAVRPAAAQVEASGGAPWRLLLAVSFGTAVASFIYEIAWIRMLSLVLGSATHAFELMLSAFILGLALGAFWIRSRADRVADPMRMLGIVQFAMGALAILTLGVYANAFDWMAALIGVLEENEGGYRVYNVARYGISLAVMLPATFCAGITLPLITRMLLAAGGGERAIGRVYAWNTLGSIVGVALAALVLMPLVGLRAMLIIGGGLDIALGVWLLWRAAVARPHTRQTATLATAAAVAAIAGAALAPSFDPGLLTSGVFRYGTVPAPNSRNVVFYEDGRTATVSVQLGSDSAYSLATNGKPDASISRVWFDEPAPDSLKLAIKGDESTQVLLPLITLAHAPRAREAAVIGHGSGVSSHMLLGSPTLDHLVTIDIEPQMIEAARLFLPANERVYDDPRSTFVHDDAKSFFAASGREFDLILSEPSNPWVSGVSGLFTDEFYQRVSRYLTPDGVFGQWLHLYEIEDDLVLGVLEALHRNFRAYAVYLTNDFDVLVVASNADRLPAPDWRVFGYAGVAQDLRRFRPITTDALASTLLLTRAELAPLLRDGMAGNSDFYPRLDLGAERARYLKHSAYGFLGISTERYDVAAALGRRVVPLSADHQASLSHSRVATQALAARLRRGETLPPTDTLAVNRAFQAARLRGQRLDLELASGRPPADWFVWFTEMVEVEADRHGGTMGVVDDAWYDRVERYMVAQRAPSDGVSALRFLRGAASYRWMEAAQEVEVLLNARHAGRQWLPLGLFFDAAVTARLHAGDIDGARMAFARLSSASGRNADDLRTMLLNAHVAAAERDVPPEGR
ncbi:MAG: spermine/spermidine synthase domain-containing protein [Gemmatimonadaceae bacterium]